MYSKEELEKYIYDCVKRGESTSSGNTSSSMRTAAKQIFGSWGGLLEHCGVKKIRTVSHYQKAKHKVIKITDNAALEMPEPKGGSFSSLCWKCFRPITPKENYCPWHDHFEVPENAIFFKTLKTSTNPPSQIITIVNCPLFIEETKELRKKKHEADIRQASYMRSQLMAAAYDK